MLATTGPHLLLNAEIIASATALPAPGRARGNLC